MKKVLLIIPVDIHKLRYPHVFDFLHEYEKEFTVDVLTIPERGYGISNYVARLKKALYRKESAKEALRFLRFIYRLKKKRAEQYDTVISIDNFSYVFACKFLKNHNHILWNLDFVATDHPSHKEPYERKIQFHTRKYLLANKKLIIQSSKRYQLMLKAIGIGENDAADIQVKYLPVSLAPITLPERSELKTPSDIITLIQIGGINQHRSNSCDLIAEFQKMQHIKLILHGFISPEVTRFAFGEAITRMPVFSNIDFPGHKIPQLLWNADIGFISYVATDENFVNIDWASGQLVELLRAGLPVICHGNTTLNDFVTTNGLGIGIKEMNEIHQAVSSIKENYSVFSKTARKFFEEHMDISTLAPVRF